MNENKKTASDKRLLIETDRLILRLPSANDAGSLFSILGDAETIKYMSMDPFESEEFVAECIGRWASRENKAMDFVYTVVEKDSGEIVGMINTCGLHNSDPTIGYCLNKKFWGKGYATETLRAFNEFLFEQGYDTLVIDAVDENIGSNLVIRKCGFGYIGSSMEVLSDGKPDPVKIMEYRMLRPSKQIDDLRDVEEKLQLLLGEKEAFSPSLQRYKDSELSDMYDLNQFVYSAMPSRDEIKSAIDYQKNKGDHFIKLEGRFALSKKLIDEFNLEECDELSMLLTVGNPKDWTINTNVEVKNLCDDFSIENDLVQLEMKEFGNVYGKDFTERKILHWIEKAKEDNGLNFYAAYLDGKIAGSLYTFKSGDYLLIDALVVDSDQRKKYVATTLLANAIENEGGRAFLHADPDDTPKEMYVKMGFRLADCKYGYLNNEI